MSKRTPTEDRRAVTELNSCKRSRGSGVLAAAAAIILCTSAASVFWQHGSTAGTAMRSAVQSLLNSTTLVPNISLHSKDRPFRHSFNFYFVPEGSEGAGKDSPPFLLHRDYEAYEAYKAKLWQLEGRRLSHNEGSIVSRSWRRGWWAVTTEHRAIRFDDFELIAAQVDPVTEAEKQEAFTAALRYLAAHDFEWNASFGDLRQRDLLSDQRWLEFGIIHNLLALLAALYLAWFSPRAYARVQAWCKRSRFAPNQCRNCGYDLRGANHRNCPECGAALQLHSTQD